MIGPIVKGSTELIEKVKNGEVIHHGCPACKANLVLKQFRTWNTTFGIPLFPTNEKRFVYECASCKETYDPAYRNAFINRAKYLTSSREEIEALTREFSFTILASLLRLDKERAEDMDAVLVNFGHRLQWSEAQLQEKLAYVKNNDAGLSNEVLDYFDTYRDCFIPELRDKALLDVCRHCAGVGFNKPQEQQLYTYFRHWGLSKNQFETVMKSITSI
jgi:hypothetical protein